MAEAQATAVNPGERPRRTPCIIAYLSPFRIVETQSLPRWELSVDCVNSRSWDYALLHEMVGGVDVGLEEPYHLAIARDGALALPPIEPLRNDAAAVVFFNRCLAGLLLGGEYCEAISTDGIEVGSVIDWKYIRSMHGGMAASNRFHQQIRYRQAAPIEAIALHQPRKIELTELARAMKVGLAILKAIPELSGDILLRGMTGYARRDFSSALANLWISVEQILSHLWTSKIVVPAVAAGASKSRRQQLEDGRTWTAAARIETLHQIAVIDLTTLNDLSIARKARNLLSHTGELPDGVTIRSLYQGLKGLFSAAYADEIPLFTIDLNDHAISDPFRRGGPLIGEPKFWMEIPKLPGEAELERQEANARAIRMKTRLSEKNEVTENRPL